MNESDVILLLLSPAMAGSGATVYEAGLALRRAHDDLACVVPILLRDVDPSDLPIGAFRRLPMIDARELDERTLLRRLDEALAA